MLQRATAERRFQMEQGRAFADLFRNQAAHEMQMEGEQIHQFSDLQVVRATNLREGKRS